MKRPNKIERMNAYLYAWAAISDTIEEPINGFKQGVCVYLIDYYTDGNVDNIYLYDQVNDCLEELYPEWYLQKPLNQYSKHFWWDRDDKQSRITALENAIKLLA